MVRAMHDLVIAVAFLILVASPAVVAAVPIPISKRQERPADHAKGVGFLPTHR
jgi:hypothetical protein